ncbi:MAG: MraY family glycosyltransferase, partial [Candidatus Margulisiibacteriota bacterium]
MDIPADRKLHTIPLPRSGGLAIVTTFLLVNIFWQAEITYVWRILLGTAAIALLGFWDDKAGLQPKLKFIGQIIIACVTVFGFGIQIQLFSSGVINQLISIFWIVGITNALNLLDNMDGLSTGITIIASVFLLFFAVQSQQIALAMLAVSLIGSCLGFLFHNFHPASIFMGDMGSMTLGYLLAVLGVLIKVDPNWSLIRFISNNIGFPISNLQFITALVPLLILGLPLFDTTLVTLFRRLSGRSIADGGKDHTSHRIVALKVRERTAVLILYLVASCLGLSAVALAYGNLLISMLTVILLFGTIIFGFLKLSSARVYLINRRLLNELRSPYTNILKNFILRNRKKLAFLALDSSCIVLAFIASFF